mgnify:CR=1 FL=1
MPALANAVPLQLSASVSVREAKPDDAEAMLRMVQALAEYQGIRPRVSASVEDFRRDGFGPERKFEALIAERHGQPVGLALFQLFYTTWEGRRALHITDLFVAEAVRGEPPPVLNVREFLSGSLMLTLSSSSVPAGTYTVHRTSETAFSHTLDIRPTGAPTATATFPLLASGSDSQTVVLTPGQWTFRCTVVGHEAMTATLTVTP